MHNLIADWLIISKHFEEKCDLPHAIDGKHIHNLSQTKLVAYNNHTVFFSLVLLAIYDTNYCFIMFDVGLATRQQQQ